MVVPMAVEHSNKARAMNLPTVFWAFVTLLSGLSLYGLVAEFLPARPGPNRYVAIKVLVHIYALFLVCLSFSLALMVRMYVVATSLTLAAAAVLVAHRLWLCATTELDTDVNAYLGREEELQQLIELSTNVASMLFGGWFGMAFFFFQNYPEEIKSTRFLPSKYFTFFSSVGASLLVIKAVPRVPVHQQPVRELMALLCALACAVVTTAIVIAESKVGRCAPLALVPEAIAFAAWCAQIVVGLPGWLREYGHGLGEPAPHNFVVVSFSLLLPVLTYHAKDARALSSLYDEAFVLLTTADVVAALGWRLLTQPPAPVNAPEVQAAAKILAFFTYWLWVLSVLVFMGVAFGL